MEIDSISVLTLFLLLVAIGALIWQLKDFRRNQSVAAIEVANRWNADGLAGAREAINRMVPNGPTPIDLAALRAKLGRRRGAEGLPDWDAFSGHLVNVLNHLQLVSAGIDRRIVDPELAYRLYGHIIVNHFFALYPFISEFRRDSDVAANGHLKTWDFLEKTAWEWGGRMVKEANPRDAAELVNAMDHVRAMKQKSASRA